MDADRGRPENKEPTNINFHNRWQHFILTPDDSYKVSSSQNVCFFLKLSEGGEESCSGSGLQYTVMHSLL